MITNKKVNGFYKDRLRFSLRLYEITIKKNVIYENAPEEIPGRAYLAFFLVNRFEEFLIGFGLPHLFD
jgi:hypothetical protein